MIQEFHLMVGKLGMDYYVKIINFLISVKFKGLFILKLIQLSLKTCINFY